MEPSNTPITTVNPNKRCGYCSLTMRNCKCREPQDGYDKSYKSCVDGVVARYRALCAKWRANRKLDSYTDTYTGSVGPLTYTVVSTKSGCVLTLLHNQGDAKGQNFGTLYWSDLVGIRPELRTRNVAVFVVDSAEKANVVIEWTAERMDG